MSENTNNQNQNTDENNLSDYKEVLRRRRDAAAAELASINTPLIADPPFIQQIKEDTKSIIPPNPLTEERLDNVVKGLQEAFETPKETISTVSNYVQEEGSVIESGSSVLTTDGPDEPVVISVETKQNIIDGPIETPSQQISENLDMIAETEPVVIVTPDDENTNDDNDDDVYNDGLDDIISDEINNESKLTDNTEVLIDTNEELVSEKTEESTEKKDIPSFDRTYEPVKIGNFAHRKDKIRVSGLNPGANIKVVDSEEYQMAVIEQYIKKSSVDSFVGPKSVSRTILPYSGIYYDISSYTNVDMLGIHRSTTDIPFVEKIEKELISAYEHTINNSLKRKLDFVEWLRNIKYPDLWCIYWGIYNVNHPGINSYKSKCDNCPEIVEERRDNDAITFVSPQSKEDIDKTTFEKIRNGTNREFLTSYKVATTLIERSDYLNDSKIKVFFGIPSMDEVLTFLKYLKTDLGEDDSISRRVLYPLSHLEIDRANLSKGTISKILTYKYMLYVRKLYVPTYKKLIDGKVIVTYVNVEPILISPILNDLSSDDFKQMVNSSQVRRLMVKEGVHYRVTGSICPKCKTPQLVTALDMRDIIFTRAEALAESLMNT